MKVLTARQAWEMLEKTLKTRPAMPMKARRVPFWWMSAHRRNGCMGLPDADAMTAPLLCITWQPDRQQGFVEALLEAVPDQQTPLLFLCRSGCARIMPHFWRKTPVMRMSAISWTDSRTSTAPARLALQRPAVLLHAAVGFLIRVVMDFQHGAPGITAVIAVP